MNVGTNVPDDVIDQYLQMRLGENELQEFEIRLLEDPQFFQKVQEMDLLHRAFKEQKPLVEEKQNVRHSPRVLPFALWIKQPISLAASLLIAVGLVFSGNNYLQQIDEWNAGAGYAVNSVINIGQLRSAANDVVLTSGVHLLQVDVGVEVEQSAYLLELRNESVGTRQEFRAMPDGNGVVRLLTPMGLSGPYRLTVRKENAPEPVASYQLRFE